MAEFSPQSVFSTARHAGCLPFLKAEELDILAPLLAYLQQQILEKSFKSSRNIVEVEISPEEVMKLHVSARKNSRHDFERVAVLLGGIKIGCQIEENKNIQLELFCKESWVENRLNLTLSQCGLEMLCGYVNPYAELNRQYNGQTLIAPAFAGRAPLSIWKSAWLDLHGFEQYLLFKMERSFQWEQKCINLDGMIINSFEEFFFPKKCDERLLARYGKKVPEQSLFFSKLKLMLQVGRKLVEHGYLSEQVDEFYLPKEGNLNSFSPSVSGLSILGRLSDDRLSLAESAFFHDQVSRIFAQNEANSKLLFQLLLPPSVSNMQVALLEKLVREVGDKEISASVHDGMQRDCVIFPALSFFIELQLRQIDHHPLPLPDLVKSTPAAFLARFDPSCNDLLPRFLEFVSVTSNSSIYFKLLQEDELISIASEKSLHSKTLKDFMNEHRKINNYDSRRSIPLKVVDIEPVVIKQSLNNNFDRTENKPTITPTSSNQSSSLTRMRQIAAKELQKLVQTSPEAYQELKKKYLASLDESAQSLIVEVKRQMHPELFEEHLKRKLVGYMVKNPSAWSTNQLHVM
ncbi:MAG: hypothetical protein KBD78_13540 [Oligoflexales bacterium]|nr:hypothetical protein [Oligoflexales bacterium]